MNTPHDVDGVVDSIDGALLDWSTSKDAMRWMPPPEEPADPTTVVYAFHDEDGLLRITTDPQEAAEAPGPVSIGFDPAGSLPHRNNGCSVTPIYSAGLLGAQYLVVEAT